MGEVRQRGRIWWVRYYRNGKRYEESSGSTKKGVATDLLKVREGAEQRQERSHEECYERSERHRDPFFLLTSGEKLDGSVLKQTKELLHA